MSTASSVAGRRHRPFFWEEFAQQAYARRSTWAERGLRALRDGLGSEPGAAPAMRHLHRVELTDSQRDGDRLPDSYRAEHAALTLYGLHQAAGADPVHYPSVGLGTAVRSLREGVFSSRAGAAERRLLAAASAQDLEELVQHLRGLVPLLRHAAIGLDYTRLYRDLVAWQTPDNGRVLRAWGLQYTAPAPAAVPEAAPRDEDGGRRYWSAFVPGHPRAGADLAALRSGGGRAAGTVPAMWPFYRTRISKPLRDKGALTRDLVAEHSALTVFGLHQQGRTTTLHVPGTTPGDACRALLARGSGTDHTAIERRLGALLTSLDAGELAHHLRGLVPLLRRAGIGLDYDDLCRALRYWDEPQRPQEQPRIRNRWDRDFHTDPTAPRT
ncbi:type I-E CRISPR-associated protein Cse2/CasB [Streptomyces sp. 2A115]|uniref:type I-E CRISPR-associated protein Cse2/CasB n=1 Tax=Streptomyces sp. 2A115 TaxID=3457439 RepID=UPI003FD3FA90